jgi:hypothetical protein
MIPANSGHNEVTSGALQSTSFGISLNDSAHLMSILRDTLYTDKVLAVIREYAANAWDAHRMVGKADLPIKVTLPGDKGRDLVIRDYGPGISPDDMLRIFTQYGASTKRNSNDAVGMLGIGSKSGFSYTESFQITSFHGGVKRVYIAAMDASNKGVLNLLHEEPTEETGFEVRIAVRAADVWNFRQTAQNFFRWMTPHPDLTADGVAVALADQPKGTGETKSGLLMPSVGNTQWTAVMGCVPYRLDLSKVEGVQDFLKNSTSGVLFFDIGEVQVSASREEIKYSDQTKQAVIAKLDALLDEFGSWLLKSLNDDKLDYWQRRWTAVGAANLVPSVKAIPSIKDLLNRVIDNSGDQPFAVYQVEAKRDRFITYQRESFHLDTYTKFVVVDSIQKYTHDYRDTKHVVLVPRVDGVSAKDFLDKHRLTGAPLFTMDDLRRMGPTSTPKKRSSNGRVGRAFRLRDNIYHVGGWTCEDLPTDKLFILVPIDRFKCDSLVWLGDWSAIAKRLDLPPPQVYGIKKGYFTDKLKDKYPLAIQFKDWTSMVAATANASEDLVNLVCSVSLSGSFNFFNHHIRAKLKDMLRGHPVLSKFLLEPAKEDRSLAQKALHVGLFKDLDFSSEVEEVHNRYPLMAVIDRGLGYYASAHDAERNIKALVQYIQLIDKANEEALVVKEGAA